MSRKDLTVMEWMEEIDRGLTYRQKYGLEGKWSELEALFFNVHKSNAVDGPNIIYATGDTLLSALTVPNPYVTPKPKRPDAVEMRPVVENVCNTLLEEMGTRTQMERATLHAFLWSRGVLKMGYDSEYGFDPTLDIGMDEPTGMTLSQYDSKGNRIEFGSAKPGMPWVSAVMPHDIVVPWGTVDLETAAWVAHRVVRHIDDLQADVKYENKTNLQPCMSMEDYVKSYTTPMKAYRLGEVLTVGSQARDGAEFCELWEIHDRRTGRLIVVGTGHKKFLRNQPDLCQLDGLPFVEVGFVPKARTFWTTSDAYYLRQAQAELTDISLQSTKHRRMSVLRFLYNSRLLSAAEFQRLVSSDVGGGLGVNLEMSDDIAKAVLPLQAPPNLMLYQEEEKTRRNARETVGFSRMQYGEFEAAGRRSATEAATVDRNSMRRLSRRHMAIRDAYIGVTKKALAMVRAYWRTPRIAEILDPNGQQQWIAYVGAAIPDSYAYQIGFSDEPVETLQSRKQNAIQLFATLAQDPTVDPIQLRRYLAAAFNDAEFSRIFKPGILEGDPRAVVQLLMQQMQDGGRQVPSNGGQGQVMALPAEGV